MERILWTVLLFVLVFVIVVAVLVWNIILVSRTKVSTERNVSLVQESMIDGVQADLHGNAAIAAIMTQRAITRLDTLSILCGGNAPLANSTHVDIDKLRSLLTEQMRQISDFLPDTAKHPFLEVDQVD